MNAIQKLDQAEAITSARELVRAAFQLYQVAMNMAADAGRSDVEETLASSSGVIAADATILGLYLRETELEAEVEAAECSNTYHLDHLRKHGACPTCKATEEGEPEEDAIGEPFQLCAHGYLASESPCSEHAHTDAGV